MTKPKRLDRNGIPILDPPAGNQLPKPCHPSMHRWGREPWREDRMGWLSEPVRCQVCGVVDYDSEGSDT